MVYYTFIKYCGEKKLKSNPKVTLIIPNLNGKKLLKKCLTSLKKLNYEDYEIIVSDGGSTDGTCEMIKRDFKNVRLIKEKGAGIGRSNNLGIKAATGEIIAFDLNNDEIFHKDWLKKLVEVLLSSPEIGIVGGSRIVYGTRNIIDEAGYRFNILGMAHNNNGLSLEQLPKEPEVVDFVGIPVFRRNLIYRIGMCDEQYHIYNEDSDFCLRANRAGFKTLWVPTAISYHRRHSTISSQNGNKTYIFIRNNLRFFIKNLPFRLLLTSLFFQVIIFPYLKIFYSILFYKMSIFRSKRFLSVLYVKNVPLYFISFLKGLWWNIKNLESTLSLRRIKMF